MQIRTFVPPADLDKMNDIVLTGFDYPDHPEWNTLADEKESMLERTQNAKRAWPILRVLQLFSPLLRDVLRGFIAEENGAPAALINYSRQREEPEWYIANVTVLPAFRRRGLARQLVEKTLKDLRARQAHTILLDVLDENLPAIKLYESIGFDIFSGTLEMDREAGAPISSLVLPEGYSLRPLSRFNWRTGFALAKEITPESVQRFEPVIEKRFRVPFSRGLVGALFENIFGDKSRKVALCTADRKVVGLARYNYRTRAGGINRIEASLSPAHTHAAGPFLSHILVALQTVSPGRRTEVEAEAWQPAVGAAAEALGCKMRFGVKRMGLKL